MNVVPRTGKGSDGHAVQCQLGEDDFDAVQLDFYIPVVIWDHPRVQAFLRRVESLESAGTIFNGLTGIWQGQPEQTRIFRIIRRRNKIDYKGMHQVVRADIAGLMVDLATADGTRQSQVMYTETSIRVYTTDLLRRG